MHFLYWKSNIQLYIIRFICDVFAPLVDTNTALNANKSVYMHQNVMFKPDAIRSDGHAEWTHARKTGVLFIAEGSQWFDRWPKTGTLDGIHKAS